MSITQDLTKGSPAKIIIKFSIPMLIGNIFQQLYNMVDTIVVGKFVNSDALAAVGNTSSLIFLIYGLTFGLSSGISIVISQYFGAREYDKVRKGFATAAYIVIVAGILMGIMGLITSHTLLKIIKTPDSIIGQSEIYMKICFAGMLGVACYNGISGILRAFGDSVTPLIFLVISSLLNVGLDLLFVIVFHWGVAGTAIATVISQFVSAVGCTLYAIYRIKLLRIPREEFRPDLDILHKYIRMGIPVALQNSFISISLIVLQGVINNYSEVVIAANTAISRIEQLVLQPGMSVGIALASYVGQNVGAGQMERVKKGLKSASIIIIAFSIIMIPVMYFGGGQVMRLFAKNEDYIVVKTGITGIRISSLFYPFVGMIFVTRNFLSGAGDIKVPMIMGFSEVICRVSLALLITAIIGYTGIWWATGINWLITCFVGVVRVVFGGWKNKAVISNECEVNA